MRARARSALLAWRVPAGHWEGRLSSSALSTATAVIALAETVRRQSGNEAVDPAIADGLIRGGLRWLISTQNVDGGWGDTRASASNISTTALCWAALAAVTPDEPSRRSIGRAEAWLEQTARGLAPRALARAIEARYGRDRTFSVPILTALAIAGRLGPDPWRTVRQLPFELAACPHQWFKWLRLPVVSYALPALIAIGHARHHALPTRNPLIRAIRNRARARTLAVLASIQPSSGGFLEAVPLTSFVVMSLAACGTTDAVVQNGVAFLVRGVRADGSWPIDTNLATWLTTLSVKALASGPGTLQAMALVERQAVVNWLLAQHYREEHPYTHAAPGGWAWTDLPGGVPDADDTAGALVALACLDREDARVRAAARAGVGWLLTLQNRDGGIPTFCRGWGYLPFDRSGADLTAHAVRAWLSWRENVPDLRMSVDRALASALEYLRREQRPDGAWVPLWFGNERARGEHNLTYGTANVLPAVHGLVSAGFAGARALVDRGVEWLLAAQRPDGGWGGDRDAPHASIEETALAVWGLNGACRQDNASRAAIERGLTWLHTATDEGRRFEPTPIGFYFANLWYSEALYPLIFTVAAAESASRLPVGPASVPAEATGV